MTSLESFTECWIHHNQSLCSLRSEFVRYLRCYSRISSRTKNSCSSTTPFAEVVRSTTIYIPTPLRLMTDIFGWLDLIFSLQRSVLLLNGLWSPFSLDFKSVEPPKTRERFVKWTTLRTRKQILHTSSCKWRRGRTRVLCAAWNSTVTF